MGVQEILLVLMVAFSFCSAASLENFVPENTQENMNKKAIGEESIFTNGGGSVLVNQRKLAHGAGGGAGSGSRSPGGVGSENGNGGQPQGGTAVIPVYSAGAGAAAQRNHHKAAATCTSCFKGRLPVLLAATSASLLLHISL